MALKKQHLGIIGSGIAGLTTAYALTKKGHQVTLVERHPTVASECSFANGGQLSACNSETWHTWRMVARGLRSLLSKNQPFSLSGPMTLEKMTWIAEFLATVIKGRYQRNTEQLIALALASRARYESVIEEEQLQIDRSKNGIIHFYRTQATLVEAQRSCELFADTGWDRTVIDVTAIEQLEPNLKTDNICGGTFTPSDFSADIHLFCQQLLRTMQKKYDVTLITEYQVDAIRPTQNGVQLTTKQDKCPLSFDQLIVAAGVDTDSLLQPILNKRLGIYPVKGYSLTVPILADQKTQTPLYSLIDSDQKIVSATLGSRFRVAGRAELAGNNSTISAHKTQVLKDWVAQNFPHLSNNECSEWACLRPMRADMLPLCKKVHKNIYVHAGGGHLGWTIAFELAERIATDLSKP